MPSPLLPPLPLLVLLLPSLLLRPAAWVAAAACPSRVGPGHHTVRLSLSSGGVAWERSVEVHVPHDMPARPRPAVLMWHGCGSDPEKFVEESEMQLRAAERRFQYYTIWPRGTSASLAPSEQHSCQSVGGVRCGWNSAFPGNGGCDVPSDPFPDDVGFARAILAWVEANLCVDPARVFAAGFSNGAQLTYRLNCELAEPFAAMMTIGATASAAVSPGAPSSSCTPSKQLPAINVCGSLDGCYGVDGATLRAQLEVFGAANNCSSSHGDEGGGLRVVERRLSATSYCLVAEDCPSGRQTEACGVLGLGHCWPSVPGAGDAPCQNQSPENFDCSTYVLEFFDSIEVGPRRRLSDLAIAAVVAVAVVPSFALGGLLVSRWRASGAAAPAAASLLTASGGGAASGDAEPAVAADAGVRDAGAGAGVREALLARGLPAPEGAPTSRPSR